MITRLATLTKWTRDHGWTRGAELGLSLGWLTFNLLKNCPDLFLVCVDPWAYVPGSVAGGDKCYRNNWDHQRRERAWRTAAKQWPDRYDLLNMTTDEAAALVDDRSLDFVFVDADHSEAGVRADIENWRPKIKPGGWLIGHDINLPGVNAAVNALCPEFRTAADNVWYLPQTLTAVGSATTTKETMP